MSPNSKIPHFQYTQMYNDVYILKIYIIFHIFNFFRARLQLINILICFVYISFPYLGLNVESLFIWMLVLVHFCSGQASRNLRKCRLSLNTAQTPGKTSSQTQSGGRSTGTGIFATPCKIFFILTQSLENLIGVLEREGVVGDINNTVILRSDWICHTGSGQGT